MKRLGITIDPIVALREWGGTRTPDPLSAIAMMELAGVDSVVYTLPEHPSPQVDRDLRLLKDIIHSHFNLRIGPEAAAVQKAVEARAEMVTLVGFENGRATGVRVEAHEQTLAGYVRTLRAAGAVVNILIEPDAHQIKAATRFGCDYVDFFVNRYVHADSMTLMEQELENLRAMALAAAKLKLGVSVSGDLDYNNVRPILDIGEIEEINVGDSILNRALFFGYDQAIRDFTAILK